jgi:hypothetical protein
MLTFPVHTRKIAAFHYDPQNGALRASFRSGEIHELSKVSPVFIMQLISKLPVEASQLLKPPMRKC